MKYLECLTTIPQFNKLPSELVMEIKSFVPFYGDSYNKGEIYLAITRKLATDGKCLKHKVSSWKKSELVRYLKAQSWCLIKELQYIKADSKWANVSMEQLRDATELAYAKKRSCGNDMCIGLCFSSDYYKVHRTQSRAMLIHEVQQLCDKYDLDIDRYLKMFQTGTCLFEQPFPLCHRAVLLNHEKIQRLMTCTNYSGMTLIIEGSYIMGFTKIMGVNKAVIRLLNSILRSYNY